VPGPPHLSGGLGRPLDGIGLPPAERRCRCAPQSTAPSPSSTPSPRLSRPTPRRAGAGLAGVITWPRSPPAPPHPLSPPSAARLTARGRGRHPGTMFRQPQPPGGPKVLMPQPPSSKKPGAAKSGGALWPCACVRARACMGAWVRVRVSVPHAGAVGKAVHAVGGKAVALTGLPCIARPFAAHGGPRPQPHLGHGFAAHQSGSQVSSASNTASAPCFPTFPRPWGARGRLMRRRGHQHRCLSLANGEHSASITRAIEGARA
jgi:hypothetical protein